MGIRLVGAEGKMMTTVSVGADGRLVVVTRSRGRPSSLLAYLSQQSDLFPCALAFAVGGNAGMVARRGAPAGTRTQPRRATGRGLGATPPTVITGE